MVLVLLIVISLFTLRMMSIIPKVNITPSLSIQRISSIHPIRIPSPPFSIQSYLPPPAIFTFYD
jgi:hypothetical protein